MAGQRRGVFPKVVDDQNVKQPEATSRIIRPGVLRRDWKGENHSVIVVLFIFTGVRPKLHGTRTLSASTVDQLIILPKRIEWNGRNPKPMEIVPLRKYA